MVEPTGTLYMALIFHTIWQLVGVTVGIAKSNQLTGVFAWFLLFTVLSAALFPWQLDFARQIAMLLAGGG